MNIRRATAEDAALLAGIHATSFPPDDAWSESTMTTLLGMPGALALLAEADGMVLLRQAADEAEILTFAVRPAARRAGLASALLETGMVLLAATGTRALLLEVAEDNTAALALYAAAGFAEAARRRDYYGKGRHARLLRREL